MLPSYSLMAHPLLRIWQIHIRFTYRGAITVMRHGRVIFKDVAQDRYTHCEARHRK